jgi:putative ABC transport system permease protein
MRWLREVFRRRELEQQLDEEIRFHVERQVEAYVAGGMNPDEARRRANLELGGVEQIKEECREQRMSRWAESFAQDVRYGLRTLGKNPAFTTVAIVTLALGIGANTAIFSLVYATLLKPLVYRDADRIVTFRGNHSLPDALDINRMSRTLQHVGVSANWPFDYTEGATPEQVDGAIIGGDLFKALSVSPALGRYFTQEDDNARRPVAVVSNGFWHRVLGGDPKVLGRKLTLSDTVYTVIGVMPPNFRFPSEPAEVWVPFTVGYPEAVEARGAHFTYPVARLREGVTLEQAQAELKVIGEELGRLHPEEARTFMVMPLRTRMTMSMRTPLLVLFGAVSMVLLIACVNFSSLLLTRTASRKQEFQVRMALGADRWRVLRQIVTESVVVACLGAVAGILLAQGGSRLLLELKPEAMRSLDAPVLSVPTLAFAIAISVVSGIVFGLVPALHLFSANSTLRGGSRTTTARTRLRSTMVVAECAMALVLLTGAGLLLRSFWKLLNVGAGFNPQQVLTLRLTLPAIRYNEIPKQVDFLTKLDQELQQVPGIEMAGLVSELPMTGSHMEHNTVIKGRPEVPAGQEPEISAHEASPKYFETMQIPLLSGRLFNEDDRANSAPVVVISRSMAQQYWPNQNPIGAQVAWARAQKTVWMTVVGVVGDVRHDGLDDEAYPAVYSPMTQKQMPWKRFVNVVARTKATDPTSASAMVKQAIWKIDPQLPVTHLAAMTEVLSESTSERRFNVVLLSAFAGLALVLAMVGIYGITAYMVTQRTQEIGIRMALGARPQSVLRMMISQGILLSLVGAVLGAVGSYVLSRVAQGMLFQVGRTDPATFAASAATLIGVAALACYIPARRAARVDPMSALRLD